MIPLILNVVKNFQVLEEILQLEKNIRVKCFIKAFETFNEVVSGCFGNELAADIAQNIQAFREAYLSTDATVTPKVHAVFHHVLEFIELKGCGLEIYNEQSTEALHSSFKQQWERFKVHQTHPMYNHSLLNCVIDYNSKRL